MILTTASRPMVMSARLQAISMLFRAPSSTMKAAAIRKMVRNTLFLLIKRMLASA